MTKPANSPDPYSRRGFLSGLVSVAVCVPAISSGASLLTAYGVDEWRRVASIPAIFANEWKDGSMIRWYGTKVRWMDGCATTWGEDLK